MNNFKGCVHCVCLTGSGRKRYTFSRMFTEQKVYELNEDNSNIKYRQYKHEICKMRYKINKFMVKYQVLKSEMGQIPVCALP